MRSRRRPTYKYLNGGHFSISYSDVRTLITETTSEPQHGYCLYCSLAQRFAALLRSFRTPDSVQTEASRDPPGSIGVFFFYYYSANVSLSYEGQVCRCEAPFDDACALTTVEWSRTPRSCVMTTSRTGFEIGRAHV